MDYSQTGFIKRRYQLNIIVDILKVLQFQKDPMRKLHYQITKLFLEHTPAFSRQTVEKCIKQSNLSEIEDEKRLKPLVQYITLLQKHKEYLDFFQIGVVRDQRKKIENVAKYVGLAIRDYEKDQQSNDKKWQQMKKQKNNNEDLSAHSQIIQSWVQRKQEGQNNLQTNQINKEQKLTEQQGNKNDREKK